MIPFSSHNHLHNRLKTYISLAYLLTPLSYHRNSPEIKRMDDNNEQPPDEPIIIPILASLNIDDIPTIDLQMAKNDDRISPQDVDEVEV